MLFIFDLDGTIVFNGNQMSATITQCLKTLSKDHEVIFASARPIRDMYPVIHPTLHELPLIGANGGLISKQGKLISSESFDNETKLQLFSILTKYQCKYIVDGLWNYSYYGEDDHPIICNVDNLKLGKHVEITEHEHVVKILILSCTDHDQVIEELKKLNVNYHIHTSEHTIDISPNNVDKAKAINQLGINENTYIAFGNDNNDIEMFKNAKYSVMIGNNELLLPHASDQIEITDDTELDIINKIKYLQAKSSSN